MSNIEDEIIETLLDNEFLLFPKDAANIDNQSLDAFKNMYKYDMEVNKDILGDVDFDEYLKSFNTRLVEQRANLKTSSTGEVSVDDNIPYVGPVRDLSNNVQERLESLRESGQRFDNDYNKVKASAIRAHDTLASMKRNLPETIENSINHLKNGMLSETE